MTDTASEQIDQLNEEIRQILWHIEPLRKSMALIREPVTADTLVAKRRLDAWERILARETALLNQLKQEATS